MSIQKGLYKKTISIKSCKKIESHKKKLLSMIKKLRNYTIKTMLKIEIHKKETIVHDKKLKKLYNKNYDKNY